MPEKRKVGRPANPDKVVKADIHLWLMPDLLKRIDTDRGEKEERTAYIIRILTEHLDQSDLLKK